MKRWLAAIAIVIAAAVAGVLSLPLLVSTEGARDRIAASLGTWLGVSVRVDGEPSLTLFPTVRVVLPDVVADNESLGVHAEIESVEADLGLVGLLTGKIIPTRFLLWHPAITTDLAAWQSGKGAYADTPFARTTTSHKIAILDGSITLAQADGAVRHFDRVDATIDWPGASGAAALTGQFDWRGEAVEVRARLADTASLTGATPAELTLALVSSPLRVNFEGTIADIGTLQADGTLAITAPNLRRVASLLGPYLGEGATLGAFALGGTARMHRRGLVLSQAKIELDGNTAEGALAVEWGGTRPSVKGTLAADKLDLTGYVSEAALAHAGVAPEEIALSGRLLHAADIDVQLSAGQIGIGATSIAQVALSLLVQDGSMATEVGKAVLYGGDFTAQLAASAGSGPGNGLSVELAAEAKDIDLAAVPHKDLPVYAAGGTGALSLNAEGSGATVGGLLSSLDGKFKFDAENPVLEGFDLSSVIATFTDGGATTAATNRTAFDAAAITGTIRDGRIEIADFSADGPSAQIRASGHALLKDLTLALSGDAYRLGAAAERLQRLPFLVRGRLHAPQFLPDLNRALQDQPGPGN